MIGFASIDPFGLEATLEELNQISILQYPCLVVELLDKLWVQLPLPFLFEYIHNNIITQIMSKL
jgi:hypothetical protein